MEGGYPKDRIDDSFLGLDTEYSLAYILLSKTPDERERFRMIVEEEGEILGDSTNFIDRLLLNLDGNTSNHKKPIIVAVFCRSHLSTLIIDPTKIKKREGGYKFSEDAFYSFDTMGKVFGSHLAEPSIFGKLEIKSLKEDRIQGASGCGYLTSLYCVEALKRNTISELTTNFETDLGVTIGKYNEFMKQASFPSLESQASMPVNGGEKQLKTKKAGGPTGCAHSPGNDSSGINVFTKIVTKVESYATAEQSPVNLRNKEEPREGLEEK